LCCLRIINRLWAIIISPTQDGPMIRILFICGIEILGFTLSDCIG